MRIQLIVIVRRIALHLVPVIWHLHVVQNTTVTKDFTRMEMGLVYDLLLVAVSVIHRKLLISLIITIFDRRYALRFLIYEHSEFQQLYQRLPSHQNVHIQLLVLAHWWRKFTRPLLTMMNCRDITNPHSHSQVGHCH